MNINIDQEIKDYQKKIKDLKIGHEMTLQDFSKINKVASSNIKSSYSKLSFSLQRTINLTKANNDDSKLYYSYIFWAGEGVNYSHQLAATTNKGIVYLYNSNSKEKIHEFNLTNSELNTCCIETTENNLLAAGGFDGNIYVTNINNVQTKDKKENSTEAKKFPGHQGVVSCCRFLNPFYLISSSYDSVILLWDINSQGKSINSYHDHSNEVSGLDVNDTNGNIFTTGSGDTTVKLWDIREKKACVATFKGPEGNVSCVKFLPGRLTTLAAGSEDSTIRIYDLRALKELACLKKEGDFNSINSVGFSKSGQFLFAGSNNSSKVNFWDILNDVNTSIYTYEHKGNTKGVKQVCIDSTGSNISYITEEIINIIK